MNYSPITKLSILPSSATILQLTFRFLKGRHPNNNKIMLTKVNSIKEMYLQKLPGIYDLIVNTLKKTWSLLKQMFSLSLQC